MYGDLEVRVCVCVRVRVRARAGVGGGGGIEQRHVTEEILRPISCRYVLIE